MLGTRPSCYFFFMTQSKVFDQTFVLSIRLRSGVVRGGQPLTGVQGCPLVLSLSLAPPAARKKKEKGFFGEYKPPRLACPEPRQRAGRPLQSHLRSGSKSLEQTFLKFALCHDSCFPRCNGAWETLTHHYISPIT